MKRKIGCNLVDTVSDGVSGFYTRDAYRSVLNRYARYRELIGALEFSHVTEISPEEAVEIGDLARGLGFETWSIHSEHLNVGDRVEDYLTLQKHEAEVCAALGCEVMVCHLPNLRPYVDFERDLDVIGQVADLTRASGVRLAVETCVYPDGNGGLLPDAELVIRVVETLNREDVGIASTAFFPVRKNRPSRIWRAASAENSSQPIFRTTSGEMTIIRPPVSDGSTGNRSSPQSSKPVTRDL